MTGLLEGKRALVTGAGRGLGAAIAEGLAAQGAAVILVDIDPETASATAAALVEAGYEAEGHGVDVTDRAAVQAFAAEIFAKYGSLDVLVNNAGVAGRAAFDEDHAPEVFDRVMGVNLNGAFNVSHAFVPALKAAKGSVVHLSSVAGYVAGGSTAGYVVSKGGIRSLTQVMARDLSPYGIRVNAIAPGIMKSEMATAQLNRPGGADWFMNRVMMKRLGETAEVIGPVVFLASDMASYITGTTLAVDGGFLSA